MGRIFWVDNSLGNDTYDGVTHLGAFASVKQSIDDFELYGSPGDTIRICHTGIDYTHGIHNYLDDYETSGTGWDANSKILIEGYDPSGGRNRPKLTCVGGAVADYYFKFQQHANFFEFRDLWFTKTHISTTNGSGAIYLSSNLIDHPSFFKFRNCIFEGLFTDTGYDKAFYISGGAPLTLDIQFCLFKNLYAGIFHGNASPRPASFVLKNNIFWN
jgi:hypothetical protein